jgi:chaperonin GroEL|tara:strand:+ start:53714 stop:55285 length:1572 start_codon:yes stop_codon:yes gene_type:complete
VPQVKYDNDESLQKKILEGANILADNVASTLGPRGRNVILQEKNKAPFITKDGVTVAKFVFFDDLIMNSSAQIIKQAAIKTNSDAGDGTTTSTVIARSLINNAQKYITAGVSPIELKRGMDLAGTAVCARLLDMALPVKSIDDIAHIATISANNDKSIGDLVAMAVDRVGKDGSVTIQEARAVDTTLDVTEGFKFDSGYCASAFITDERRGVMKYTDPLILVTDAKISAVEQILPTLELVSREGRPLVIVAEEIEGQALAALIMNAMRGTLKVGAIKAPRYGEERRNILSDLALSINAEFITRESGIKLSEVKLKHFGSTTSIESSKYNTTIVGANSDYEKVDERIQLLKKELSETESIHECESIQERITRLASGVAVIYVGAHTEIEMIEKKHRIEDALEAVKSAQAEGVVSGGGTALIRACNNLVVEVENSEQDLGVKIVLESAFGPLRQMALNAGASADLIIQDIDTSSDEYGYDFRSREMVNMIEAGIIDPVKVTRCALQNAISVAGTLITTNYAIVQV